MEKPKPMSRSPRLGIQEFQELQLLFNEVAGLRFDDSALSLFERRLAARLPVHELTDYKHYLRVLQVGPQSAGEMAAALDLLTSGETYFFRHQEQLALFSSEILPAVAESNQVTRQLTIWSAGCSSGEEAYTMGMLVRESRLFPNWNIRILGTDLSHERIEHARQACYFQGAFRSTEERLRARYFTQSGKIWQVRDEIRDLCQFAPLNLLGPELDAFVNRVDIVSCRNVLIYLDERSRTRVIENLYEHMAPGGFLLLGHSESLKFMDTAIELSSMAQDLAFRKPLRAQRRGGEL
jgi:chemotaxis protein methyltransferase CheR